MKPTKGAILPYKPEQVPADLPDSARRYLDTELNRVAGVLQALMSVVGSSQVLTLAPTGAAPAAPAAPEIRYADGVSWDPGSGEGYYYLNSHGVWTPLG